MAGFEGFPKDFFPFFRALTENNEKAWFEANKPRFSETVQSPMSDFISAMAPKLAKISKEFVADPHPNGGSMFRIHRDVRFSRDKRPYKEHAACQFRHRLGRDVHAPGFYVHIAPGEVFFGGGLWMPDADALTRIRTAIAGKSAAWKKVVADKKFVARFGAVEGDSLIRPPRGFDPDHPFIADLKRTSFVASCETTEKAVQSSDFPEHVAEGFRDLAPLMKFLCSALGVPY